ncbi:hypothetical protein C2E25_00140 [Geothermobacter hydrogeniphilus]|uniref:Uncharacterized protein n=1 Tax=Geothermobacter hydrogeniphilus TaxID=1969733 RepID=A0A2K2HEF0_9BACT|nr:hypothetical protein C2E25_00140 [Geothermobacter hydrogeniphilus]
MQHHRQPATATQEPFDGIDFLTAVGFKRPGKNQHVHLFEHTAVKGLPAGFNPASLRDQQPGESGQLQRPRPVDSESLPMSLIEPDSRGAGGKEQGGEKADD